jgi:predicted phosphodiesterase
MGEKFFYGPRGELIEVKPPVPGGLAEGLKKQKKCASVGELSEKLGVDEETLRAEAGRLAEDGFGMKVDGEMFIRTKAVEGGENIDHSDLFDHFSFMFGVLSDSHLGSKKERLDALHFAYDVLQAEGVEQVYHCGDITEGAGVYRGQELEVHKYGQEEQIQYTIDEYPKREGMTTHFITGNHDLRIYEMGGADPGVQIARQRDDMNYLGQAYARLRFPQGARVDLLHPGGGVAYALSYKSQRYINNLAPMDVPEMMFWGHYHTSFYMHYRDVHFLQAGCFKDAGIWERRLGLNPDVAGWLVQVTMSDGFMESFSPRLIKPR